MSQTTVHIVNPVEGGKRYTSQKRALQYVRRGLASMTEDGALFFLDSSKVLARRAAVEAEHDAGCVSWAGSAPKATDGYQTIYRPGERRS